MSNNKNKPCVLPITQDMLDQLSDAAKQKLKNQFGIDLEDPLASETINRQYSVSQEKVRQIEENLKH